MSARTNNDDNDIVQTVLHSIPVGLSRSRRILYEKNLTGLCTQWRRKTRSSFSQKFAGLVQVEKDDIKSWRGRRDWGEANLARNHLRRLYKVQALLTKTGSFAPPGPQPIENFAWDKGILLTDYWGPVHEHPKSPIDRKLHKSQLLLKFDPPTYSPSGEISLVHCYNIFGYDDVGTRTAVLKRRSGRWEVAFWGDYLVSMGVYALPQEQQRFPTPPPKD